MGVVLVGAPMQHHSGSGSGGGEGEAMMLLALQQPSFLLPARPPVHPRTARTPPTHHPPGHCCVVPRADGERGGAHGDVGVRAGHKPAAGAGSGMGHVLARPCAGRCSHGRSCKHGTWQLHARNPLWQWCRLTREHTGTHMRTCTHITPQIAQLRRLETQAASNAAAQRAFMAEIASLRQRTEVRRECARALVRVHACTCAHCHNNTSMALL